MTNAQQLTARMPPQLAQQLTYVLSQLASNIPSNVSTSSCHWLGTNALQSIHCNVELTLR